MHVASYQFAGPCQRWYCIASSNISNHQKKTMMPAGFQVDPHRRTYHGDREERVVTTCLRGRARADLWTVDGALRDVRKRHWRSVGRTVPHPPQNQRSACAVACLSIIQRYATFLFLCPAIAGPTGNHQSAVTWWICMEERSARI